MASVGDLSVHDVRSVQAQFTEFPDLGFVSVSLRTQDYSVRVALMFPAARADYARRLAEAISAVPVEDETEAAR